MSAGEGSVRLIPRAAVDGGVRRPRSTNALVSRADHPREDGDLNDKHTRYAIRGQRDQPRPQAPRRRQGIAFVSPVEPHDAPVG